MWLTVNSCAQAQVQMIQQGLGINHCVCCISISATEQEKRGSLSLTVNICIQKNPENIRLTLLHKLVQLPLREQEENDVSLLFLATFTQPELTADGGFPVFSAAIRVALMSAASCQDSSASQRITVRSDHLDFHLFRGSQCDQWDFHLSPQTPNTWAKH